MSVYLTKQYPPIISGSFAGTGQSAPFNPPVGPFNLSISGISSSTVTVERSFDEGSTWKTVQSISADAELEADQVEAGVLWRFNCGTYGSGTILYRGSR